MLPNYFECTESKSNFEKIILKEFLNKDDINFLQIGAFKGDATVWILDTIIESKERSSLTDVDIWSGDRHHFLLWDIDPREIESIYDKNTAGYKNLIKVKERSEIFLQKKENKYDFIYVDGDHSNEQTFMDAVLSWEVLKSNGILAFDDYLYLYSNNENPKKGIDAFLKTIDGEYQVLHKAVQYWIRKL